MKLSGIFAVACTADIADAEPWYVRLLGRAPDDRPMASLVQWRWGAAGLQVLHDADRAGRSFITIVVPDLARERSRLATAGIMLGETVTGDRGRIAQAIDPDGNVVTLAEPPNPDA